MQLPFAKILNVIQIDENPSQTKISNTLQLCQSAIVRTSQLNNTKGQDNKTRQLECTLCHSCSEYTLFSTDMHMHVYQLVSTMQVASSASAMSEITPLILANTSALAPPSFPDHEFVTQNDLKLTSVGWHGAWRARPAKACFASRESHRRAHTMIIIDRLDVVAGWA